MHSGWSLNVLGIGFRRFDWWRVLVQDKSAIRTTGLELSECDDVLAPWSHPSPRAFFFQPFPALLVILPCIRFCRPRHLLLLRLPESTTFR